MSLLAAPTASDKLQTFHVSPVAWALFLGFLVVLLLVDLFVVNKEAHEIDIREAAKTSAVWVSIGVAFTAVVWVWLGGAAASQYFTGYVIEKSLSVDNVFIWATILTYFKVPNKYQHRVLFWGIFGALVLRAIFVFGGVGLLNRFEALLYVFGALLIFTGLRLGLGADHEVHPDSNPIIKLVRKIFTVSSELDGQKLFTIQNGKRVATPLFVVLILIEATDVVFAVDSVPAVIAVSRDTFIVFSSNALAILGLRSLYFLLAGAKDRLIYLDKGLAIILVFVGIKMLISNWYHVPTIASLLFITVVLAITIGISLNVTDDEHTHSELVDSP